MKYFSWEEGRQKSGYEKMLLIHNPYLVPFDCYILRFKQGAEIERHIDLLVDHPVSEMEHHRVNIVVKKAKVGGTFYCEGAKSICNRIFYFRPDIMEHGVTRILKGTRYVLSIGWINER